MLRILSTAAVVCFVIMYFLFSTLVVLTSLACAIDYWGHWWMAPVQAFVGVFMFVVGYLALDRWMDGL